MPFPLAQRLHVARRIQPDGARIIDFLIQDAAYIFRRKPRPVVRHGDFHVCIRLFGLQLHTSSFGRIFPRVFGQGIYHEQGQGTVGLHHRSGRTNHQLLVLHLEGTPSLAYHVKQFTQREVFDVQAYHSPAHLNPKRQDIVVLIDTRYQFVDIGVLTLLHLRLTRVGSRLQLVHLINDPIDVRHNAGHDGQTGFLHRILFLVLRQMLLMDVLLLLHLPPFFFQRNQIGSVDQRPCQVRRNQLQQELSFLG